MPRSRLVLITFLTEGIALAASLFLAEVFDIDLFPLSENFFRDIIIGTGGALFPLFLFISMLSRRAERIPLIRSLRKTMVTEVRLIFSRLRFFDIIIISMMAGLAEEMLFRGILQVKFGIVLASLLFGLVHCITVAYGAVALLMGFYLGLFYLIFGTLLIPIVLHFLYDLGALAYLRYYETGEQ